MRGACPGRAARGPRGGGGGHASGWRPGFPGAKQGRQPHRRECERGAAVRPAPTQAEESCLRAVDELTAKRQQLEDTFAAQNSKAEKVQAQTEEERKKFLAVDR